MYFLVVDLEVGTPHEKLGSNLSVTIYVAKYMLETPRNDAWIIRLTQHCMCLSTASLTVGKDSSVIALDDRFYQGESTFIIHYLLQRIVIVDCIEGKRLLIALIIRFYYPYLVVSRVHFQN
jgi:hypothetical protein